AALRSGQLPGLRRPLRGADPLQQGRRADVRGELQGARPGPHPVHPRREYLGPDDQELIQMRPSRIAYTTAWVRLRSWNRLTMSCSTVLIVRCEYDSFSAISPVLSPWATRRSTSTSRSDRPAMFNPRGARTSRWRRDTWVSSRPRRSGGSVASPEAAARPRRAAARPALEIGSVALSTTGTRTNPAMISSFVCAAGAACRGAADR